MDSLTTTSCPCNNVQAGIRQFLAEGSKVEIDYRVLDVSAHDVSNGRAFVTLIYDLPPNQVTLATGKVEKYPAVNRGIKEMSFRLQGGKWLVSEIVTSK